MLVDIKTFLAFKVHVLCTYKLNVYTRRECYPCLWPYKRFDSFDQKICASCEKPFAYEIVVFDICRESKIAAL